MTAKRGVEMLRRTLRQAAEEAIRGHWAGMRSHQRAKAQVMVGVAFLEQHGRHYLEDVTDADIVAFRDWSLSQGASPATVNCRMSALSIIGVKVRYCKPSRQRKWYLAPQDEQRLSALGLPPLLHVFVGWTVATGLRVEESLALKWSDIDLEAGTVHVPGTKTEMAEALLPMSSEAKAILGEWKAQSPPQGLHVFPCSYKTLWRMWEVARGQMGLSDTPTATLKSLRRSFARRAHVNGMPIDILRQYLRHSSLKTTQAYLWLVGGYSQDEMRRYL